MTNQNNQITATIDEIFGLYSKYGEANYIGEKISQIEHMCQAAQLAEGLGYDDEVILAAFFHDIGHLIDPAPDDEHNMGGYGTKDHEKLGADYLRQKGFSEKIARLVESHVAAKRYLTYADEHYYNNLSEASKRTLEFQGGRMNTEEAQAFEQDPFFEMFIQMRKWDEQAKLENIPLPDIGRYKSMAESHLQNFHS
jgi:phosphonate degradation associated HDIG domain protein